MLRQTSLGVLLVLLTSTSGQAQSMPGRAAYYFSYADLEKIFVQNQQYFVLDNNGTNNPSLNHLHFTSMDTTNGMFTGTLWAPVVQPALPEVTVPIAGKITSHSDFGTFGLNSGGYYYSITFFWGWTNPCHGQNAAFQDTQEAQYDGAIVFRGYQGAKMQANIAGVLRSSQANCGGGDEPFSPQPFSGTLTK